MAKKSRFSDMTMDYAEVRRQCLKTASNWIMKLACEFRQI